MSNLLVHLDKYVGKPVVVDQVRVINPCHFYLGSFYYVESLDGQSRLLVLSREFPPKEGKVITILGSIQPVISVNNVNMAFFREAAVQPVDLPSTYSDRISQNAVFPSVILFPGYPSESLGVSSAERWTAERGKPSGVEAERVQEAWSIQRQTGSLFPLYVSSSYPLTSLSVNRSTGSPCSHS
ncbi:MAG: hypothetical protein H6559_00100 [Lewinellaceae bacterium]|nr:hypothetical protein [Lewinellaceae bacterium]